MEILLLPVRVEGDAAVLRLEQACISARRIEEVIRYWIGKGGHLLFCRDHHMPFPCITVSFGMEDELIALGHIPRDVILERLTNYWKLNLSVNFFSDMEGYRADSEWFDERNQKLRITWDKKQSSLIASRAALPELLTSYAETDFGYVEIGGKNNRYLTLKLVYLDPIRRVGWYEKILMALG